MGIMELLMQYFKKGLVVAARNLKCLLNNINVLMFQLMINMAMEMPTKPALIAFTLPKYSGARNKESAPKPFIKPPFTVLNSINQKMRSVWYRRKCKKSNCMGKE